MALVEEGCCCGNVFRVGPRAADGLSPRAGFRPQSRIFEAPWGERLEAAWLVGPSVHGAGAHGEHGNGHAEGAGPDVAVDPVCGMRVEAGAARAKGLSSSHEGTDHNFCGKGCKLEFDEDHERYLDPGFEPSM